MKVSDLFHMCAFDIHYESIGTDVNYAFLSHGDHLYIFFQGSEQTTDWVRNFMFPAKPYKDMEIPYKVHRGFLEAWREVKDEIIEEITQKRGDGFLWKRITVVGYSHGGALAGLCHECVWFHRPDLRENGLVGYGFEAPRFYGGYHVKKELRERWEHFHVIRNGSDIVPHCPPWILGFSHVGNITDVKGDPSLVEGRLCKCIKYHLPAVVYDGLVKAEPECEGEER